MSMARTRAVRAIGRKIEATQTDLGAGYCLVGPMNGSLKCKYCFNAWNPKFGTLGF